VTRTKIALLLSFAMVFAAGVVVGHLAWRRSPRDRRSWLGEELNLTPEQREQMRQIWSEAMGGLGAERWSRRRALAEEREQAIRELLSPEQLQEYEGILGEHERALQALAEEREKALKEAVERTKRILTPVQREEYEAMMDRVRERAARRGRGEPGRRPHRWGPPGPPPPGAPPPGEQD
jgi:Spy/CpxP family protein refolding chaperone